MNLWPAAAPGEKGDIGPEHDTTKPTDELIAGRRVARIGNVSVPTLTVYRPPADKDTGATVVVFPGGGYYILAIDLEGTEVCEWLNSIGVTGVLVKYRVPHREGTPPYFAPLQDAQRAMGIVRMRAAGWGIDPNRVGVLGFSAGGNLCAVLSAHGERAYPAVDDADKMSCRPDFQVLVYPGTLAMHGSGLLVPPEARVTPQTPPTFMVITEDDPNGPENAFAYGYALKQAGVPMELHIYPKGGHGYGLRPTKNYVTTWSQRAEDWMQSLGLLDRKP
jgi:acetyl esterase/lipase